MRNAAGTRCIWMEERLSSTNSLAGARNACKHAALNRTNSKTWHGENSTFSSVCLQPSCVSAPVQQRFMGWIACKFLVLVFSDVSSSFQPTRALALSGWWSEHFMRVSAATCNGPFRGDNLALISGESLVNFAATSPRWFLKGVPRWLQARPWGRGSRRG